MPKPRTRRFEPKAMAVSPEDRAEMARLKAAADAMPPDHVYEARLAAWRVKLFSGRGPLPDAPRPDPDHPKAIAERAAAAFRHKVLLSAQICTQCGTSPIARPRSWLCRECNAHAR